MDPAMDSMLAASVPNGFDWFYELGVIMVNETEIQFTFDHTPDWKKLLDYACDWTTCACGNMCAVIPREKDGEPKDPQLKMLGKAFAVYVVHRDAEKAARTLYAIEKRSAELIKAIEDWEKISKSFDNIDF